MLPRSVIVRGLEPGRLVIGFLGSQDLPRLVGKPEAKRVAGSASHGCGERASAWAAA